jgi:hypothetical protein
VPQPTTIPRAPQIRVNITTDGQSASLFWCRAPADFCFLSDDCGFLDVRHPLWRENGYVIYCTIASGPCQSSDSRVEVSQNSRPYFTVPFETPPTWRTRSPYLYPPGTGWPSYTPGHWVPFCRLFRPTWLRWRYSNPPPHGDFFWCLINRRDNVRLTLPSVCHILLFFCYESSSLALCFPPCIIVMILKVNPLRSISQSSRVNIVRRVTQLWSWNRLCKHESEFNLDLFWNFFSFEFQGSVSSRYLLKHGYRTLQLPGMEVTWNFREWHRFLSLRES